LQVIKILQMIGLRIGREQLLFKTAKTALQAIHAYLVLVDDKIDYRIKSKPGTSCQTVRHGFRTVPDLAVSDGAAVPDRNQEAWPEKYMGLAEFYAVVGQRGGVKDDEQGIAVFFQFGALVRLAGIFDRQFVKAELGLHFLQHLLVRFVQAHPDKGVFFLQD